MRIQQARATLSAERPTIFEQVCNFGHTQCADPSDKVYAFRALSADPHKIRVDYRQPPLSSICQVLFIAYLHRAKANTYLYEQATELLKVTSLTESQILPGLPPSPADILIESFTHVRNLPQIPFLALERGNSHFGLRQTERPIRSSQQTSSCDTRDHPGMTLFNGSRHTRYVAVSQPSTEGAYLAIDLESSGERIAQVHCMQREWLGKVYKHFGPHTSSSRHPEPESKLLSDLERMKPFRDICQGRIKLCRKAHKFGLASDNPNIYPDGVGAHVSRVALMAFLACNASWDTCPESLVDYARQHPPTPDEAECTCDVDMFATE